MVRSIVIQIMIVISLFSIWSVGFASQFDDCCVSSLDLQMSSSNAEESHQASSYVDEHGGGDCAARCTDCTICQAQCNQHGLISIVFNRIGFEFNQVHGISFYPAHPDAPLSVLKQPPRV
ncbi:hypothetical protein [Bdellovibrio sp. HCB274]|uniref:hypothetical protein n=1 Tax=Bdellovibrio sp. HCB274 TaxID=3394361 RepID=UPI0039B36499